ncbi:putative reverse transcriptase domain-containing protein [Tanacetum coccineum]|uniref:Reverse transcriptase domain-containing protein n=1 Tax=Tanacetum coccineum TaxID=301880 RepID=A0ABQ4XW89_9ASTR
MITLRINVALTANRATRGGNTGTNLSGASGSGPTRVKLGCLLFAISKCTKGKKVKFAVVTLQGPALTWWNSKVTIFGLEAPNQIPWTEMKKSMIKEFCLVEEIQRMEHELWNLKIKEFNIVPYNQRFNELALMCLRMVDPENVKVDAYIRGLFENIKGEVTSSKPTNLSEAVRMAHKLMEQKVASKE